MLHIHSLLFFSLLEALGVCLAALALWPVLAARRKRARRASMASMIAGIAEAKEQRHTETTALLKACGLTGAELESGSGEFEKQEKRFYKAFIDLYLNLDGAAAAHFHGAVHTLLEPYRALRPAAGAQPDGQDGGADTAELETQREKNVQLEEELKITRETLNNMLNEYAQMFARNDGTAGDSTAAGVLQQSDDGTASGQETGESEAPLDIADGLDIETVAADANLADKSAQTANA